jgi:hypothetical protein
MNELGATNDTNRHEFICASCHLFLATNFTNAHEPLRVLVATNIETIYVLKWKIKSSIKNL